MTTPLPEARPLAWTARRATEFERLEGLPLPGRARAAPTRAPPRLLAPVASFVRLLRGG